MRRFVKAALQALAGAAACAALCLLAAFLLVQTSWFHEKVRQRMVHEIENATGGRVEMGSFDFDWRAMSVSIRNLTIHGTEKPEEPPLFRAGLIRLGLKLISFFEERVDLESVFVERPQVNLIVYADGHTNVPHPRATGKPHPPALETVLDLAIKRVNVVDGVIQAGIRRLPLDFRGENLRAAIVYQRQPARYEADLSFRDLDLKAGGRAALAIQVDAHLALLHDRIEIRRARFATGASWLYVTGAAGRLASPEVRLEYAARVNVKDVAAGLDVGPIEHRGVVALDGRATISREAGYAVSGKLRAGGLVLQTGGIRIEDIRADSAFAARPGRVTLDRLAIAALGGHFDGRAEIADFRDFLVVGAASGFSIEQMKLIREVRRVAWDGSASGPLRLSAQVRNRRLAGLLVNANLAIAPGPGPDPIQGVVDLTYDLAAGEVSFGPSRLATKLSRVSFSGVLGRKLNATIETTDLEDARPAIAMFSALAPPEMPVKLVNGTASFRGAVTGPLSSPVVDGHVAATSFVVAGRRFDHAEADVVVSQSGLAAHKASLARLGMRASADLQIGLRDWQLAEDAPVSGRLAVGAPHLADVLAAAGVAAPFAVTTGDLSLSVELEGTVRAPAVSGHARAVKLIAAGQPLDRVAGDVRYSRNRLDLLNAQFAYGASKAQISGSYDHPEGNWRVGRLQFDLSSAGVDLTQIKAMEENVPGIQGRIETQLAGEVTITDRGFKPGVVNGRVSLSGFGVSGQQLGSLVLTAATRGQMLDARIEGSLAGSAITGAGTCALEGDYAARGRIDFTPLQFSELLARFHPPKSGEPLPFSGFTAGSIDFSGSAASNQSWRASITLPSFELRAATTPAAAAKAAAAKTEAAKAEAAKDSGLVLRNAGPVVMDVDAKGLRVRQARFEARDTNLEASGRIGFGLKNPWDLRLQGGVNLKLLEDFESHMYSSGALTLDVSVRGALASPEIYGRVDVKNASFSIVDIPNGVENANGTIFLYRDRAMIDTLTAQSGGGRVDIGGFVGLAGETTFHIQAKATGVRVRYPEGVSSTATGTVTFTGTPERSLLAGELTVTRVGLSLSSDLGSMLARTAQPLQIPLDPNRFRQGLRFDVHIVTAPQVRVETNVSKDLQASADLRLRGDDARPLLLGRVLINQGQVNFFGTQYSINSGQILFVNATKVEPTMDLSLETRVRGVNVTLHISGPMEKLNMSYTSDPPLPFSDVLALLTTGREPGQVSSTMPTASALVGQSYQSAGTSALLGEAIGSPLTGRLQRFFGVSRLKINPLVTGLTTSNAAAQITVEQNISSNLTFTYISDLSRAQAQTIQMEWDFTPNWSGLAVREDNGMFGIDFLYKKQIK